VRETSGKIYMNRTREKVRPEIFYVTRIGKKSISFSRSAIYSKKEIQLIDVKNVVNKTGLPLRIGDKIIADLQPINETFQIVIKRITATQQPVASSDKKYLRLLRIYIDCKNQFLDFQELNDILEDVLGITVNRVEAAPKNYHMIIDLSGEDPGTKRCPFILSLDSGSYPLKIDFPQVSDKTKKYLKMIHSDGKVTDTRIFAFRLIHFLLHKLGYPEHFNLQKLEEDKRVRKALREGDPLQIPALDITNACLCDWELVHFVAIQPDPTHRSPEKMLCNQCRKRRIHIGVGLKDFETLLFILKEFSKPQSHFRTEKYIAYVIESRKDGSIFNVSPYKSKITLNIREKDWNEAMIDIYENLYNIFIPNKLFDKAVEVRKGDKVLLHVRVETKTPLKESRLETRARSFKIDKIIKKGVKIINPSNLFSRIRPFRLGVTLKIGPETDLNFVQRVAKTVNRLTSWHIRIDKSSYEDLKNSFRMLTAVYKEWEKADLSDRGRLVAKVNDIINRLPKTHEVEDSFKVIVYVFPEKYSFIEDVFGNIASGKALYRTFATVSIFPSVPPEYEKQEPCKDCRAKPIIPFREEITSLFVIHEVLHIASGLDDHRNCSFCSYRRKEMQPFRRFYCEECIRKGNDQTQKNCLMSSECLPCISTRLCEKNFSDFLCEKCKKKLLPADQFVARQVTRMNSLIYHQLLIN